MLHSKMPEELLILFACFICGKAEEIVGSAVVISFLAKPFYSAGEESV